MAFNRQNFISVGNKSATERMIDSSSSLSITSQRQNISGILNQTASDLLLNGVSVFGIESSITSQTAGLRSNSEELYFALGGLQISRTNGRQIRDIRRNTNQTSEDYLRDSNPTTRIERKRRERNLEFISTI